MWHRGDYRVVIRHERRPEGCEMLEPTVAEMRERFEERALGLLDEMYEEGQTTALNGSGHYYELPDYSSCMGRGIQAISIVVLQKRVMEGDLVGWATISVGYAFCQHDDTFSRKRGRNIAFDRALAIAKNKSSVEQRHIEILEDLYREHVGPLQEDLEELNELTATGEEG